MNYKNIISEIVGDKYVDVWLKLKPKVYYKNNKPYGLMVVSDGPDGYRSIATTCINVNYNFTIGMIRDIIYHYNESPICLISGTKDRHSTLVKALDSRFNFRYETVGDILFAFGENHNV